MKVILNPDKEEVARVKEGLKRTGGIALAGFSARKTINVCARNLKSK